MRVKFNCSVDGWLVTELEGESLEDCREKLHLTPLKDLIDNGYLDFDLKNIEEEVLSQDIKVEVTNIEYDEEDLEYSDSSDHPSIEDLPKTLTLEFPDFNGNDLDLEEEIESEIDYRTKCAPKKFDYHIIA